MFPWEHLQMCEWVAEGLKLTDTTEMPNAQNTEKENHIDIHRHAHYRPSMHVVHIYNMVGNPESTNVEKQMCTLYLRQMLN